MILQAIALLLGKDSPLDAVERITYTFTIPPPYLQQEWYILAEFPWRELFLYIQSITRQRDPIGIKEVVLQEFVPQELSCSKLGETSGHPVAAWADTRAELVKYHPPTVCLT